MKHHILIFYIIGGITGAAIILSSALHLNIEDCSLTEFDPDCSPSGWTSIIIGDVVIGGFLATLMWRMGIKNNIQIDKALTKIEELLGRRNDLKNRRIIFASQNIKDEFGTILLSVELMHQKIRIATDIETIQKDITPHMEAMINSINEMYDSAHMAVEVLEPKLVGDVYNILTDLKSIQPDTGIGSGFPNFEFIKESIFICTKQLDKASDAAHEQMQKINIDNP